MQRKINDPLVHFQVLSRFILWRRRLLLHVRAALACCCCLVFKISERISEIATGLLSAQRSVNVVDFPRTGKKNGFLNASRYPPESWRSRPLMLFGQGTHTHVNTPISCKLSHTLKVEKHISAAMGKSLDFNLLQWREFNFSRFL